MSQQLRCHRCSSWIGEARQPMKLVGMFENPRDRERYLDEPRDTWRCKSCGWVNVFRPESSHAREIAVKAVAGGA